MTWLRWLLFAGLALLATPAPAADVAVATLVDGDVRVRRAASWYKVVPGVRLEAGDIVAAADRARVGGMCPAPARAGEPHD